MTRTHAQAGVYAPRQRLQLVRPGQIAVLVLAMLAHASVAACICSHPHINCSPTTTTLPPDGTWDQRCAAERPQDH